MTVHVLPALGAQRVSRVREEQVLRLIAELRRKGLSEWSAATALSWRATSFHLVHGARGMDEFVHSG